MRIGLVIQWLRAAHNDPPRRATARHYAAGVAILQLGWVGLLQVPAGLRTAGFLVLVVAELAVPIWAERSGTTPWHPHHIAERYGLLTLIVLGESVLAATLAVQGALAGDHTTLSLIAVASGALLILFAMWWIYFDEPAHDLLHDSAAAFRWGYGHYLVFASAAAVGAGLSVIVDHAAAHEHVHLSRLGASLAVAVPVALYVLTVWVLQVRPRRRGGVVNAAYLSAALLIVAAALSPWPILVIGAIMSALVAVHVLAPRTA
jgi:low temperature requirement protein LtrA